MQLPIGQHSERRDESSSLTNNVGGARVSRPNTDVDKTEASGVLKHEESHTPGT